MKFGLHISIAEGVERAPGRARAAGCECFQIFSRSPHGGREKPLGAAAVEAFRRHAAEEGMLDCFIHSPYYINLASENNRIYYGSIGAVRQELETADRLGARAVITHLGSAHDLGEEAGARLTDGLVKIFALPAASGKKPRSAQFSARLLLEITAGAGNIMGDTFEEMAEFIRAAEKTLGRGRLGVCFDTAHAFASGYDLRTPAAARRVFREFDRTVGLERIGLVHLNDSASALGSHVDRHANLGRGQIGAEGIRAILAELKDRELDFVLETPPLHSGEDLAWLKEIRPAL